MKTLIKFFSHQLESVGVALLLAFSALTFSWNMFRYPYYENDEGTYMSQAWAVLTQGELAPYTYWYDHSPAGWLLIALWELVSGGFYQFGFSINSGRVLMLVLHVISALLIYSIIKKVSGSKVAGVISVLLFSLSPLGLSFQRRVLLDNIMIFWFLVSYNLILGTGRKLHHYILSAISYSLAVLSKESAIFFLPVMLAAIYLTSHATHRVLATWKWLIATGSMISIYFLYAFLKGEFFPYGGPFGGNSPHVSLVETFQFQLGRKGGFFLDQSSGFMLNFTEWVKGGFFIPVPDPMIIVGGIIGTIIISFWSLLDRKLLAISLPTLAYWFFLMRGGEVIGFYIIPLIPFLAMCVGLSVFKIASLLPEGVTGKILKLLIVMLLMSPFVWYYTTHREVYYLDQTTPQIEAVKWISENIPEDSVLLIDNYSFIEFYEAKNNKYTLPKIAHYYWKADKDPEVRDAVLGGSWENIDYILSTPQVKYDAENSGLPLVKEATGNSTIIHEFNGNKWNIEIRKVNKIKIPLQETWTHYKDNFITTDGRVIDSVAAITTSEGQSYAMLRSVWINDQETFKKVWDWTKNNLVTESGAVGWKWGLDEDKKNSLLDEGSASDADTDIALALLLGHKKWGSFEYLQQTQTLLDGIWETEVKTFRKKNYLVPGNWAKDKDFLIMNPSYLSPYAYRIFAQADKTHDWNSLIDSSYEVLEGCIEAKFDLDGDSVGLPPNWCQIDKNGKFVVPDEEGLKSVDYSYDAVRTMWRLALDYKWYGDPRAKKLLDRSGQFLAGQWDKEGKILVGYTHDGKPWENYESVLGYSTALSNFAVTNPELAEGIYKTKVLDKFYEDFHKKLHYWEDPKNYYSQNWAWFGTALYANKLPNLWVENLR